MLRFKSGDKEFKTLKEAKDYAVRNWPATDGMTILSPTPGVGYSVEVSNSGSLTFPRVDVLCPWEMED